MKQILKQTICAWLESGRVKEKAKFYVMNIAQSIQRSLLAFIEAVCIQMDWLMTSQ